MASSDDEAEELPLSVSNYHFVDDKDEPVSFSTLPIQWSEGERVDDRQVQIFLHGTADNGLQKIYKHVIAWKFDLSNVKPEISVLSKENCWIKLQKPRKSFEEIIRSTLITVNCLHYVMRNPEASGKPLWDQIAKNFSSAEIRPSENDLVGHTSLISGAVKRNDALTKSKFLEEFLQEKPKKRKLQDEETQATTMSRFIVDDSEDDIMDDAEEDDSNEDSELFDSVCAICDNGGDLLCCEGSCLRSFHATKEAGEESFCASLGYTEEEVDAIQQFLCKNCEYKQHQCFICGKLGSSDKYSGAEVFCCVSATCGRFYHPHCVAKVLHGDNEVSAKDLEKKIAEGESFTCPVHKCLFCKQGENKKDPDLQFAICRRCPKSYHRKCLPRKISFKTIKKEGIVTRAWDNLLPNRILIYCLKHEIDNKIGTPHRNHIKFPGVEEKKSTFGEKKSTFGKKKTIIEDKRQREASEFLGDRKKLVSKVRVPPEESHKGKTASAAPKQSKPFSALKVGGKTTARRLSSGSSIPRKAKVNDASKKEMKSPMAEENKASMGLRSYEYMNERSELVKPEKQDTTKSLSSGPPPLDADSERRLLDLIKDVESSISIKDIREKHKVPTTHEYSLKSFVDSCTQGKVEAAVVAARAALRKLDDGCSMEDAEAVCSQDSLGRIFRWKNKFKVYLAPFLYGMRYTSFGRHFTSVEKLIEIVNKLHWYAQDGDMIVDFCCGANDFSILMKKKLDEMRKRCSYKNYDFIPPKSDFNFEKRDWMTVQPDELPNGSKLIMGLNPPFGVKASLANKFIDKALQFKPKLLILIVPRETQRLDEKHNPYALVWEDDRLLSGKSFYLPGSVDVKDKQMEQWNLRPPVLSLWSHPDWSAKHREIAESHEHTSRQEEAMEESPSESIRDHLVDNHADHDIIDHPMGDHDDYVALPDYVMNDQDNHGGNHMLCEDPVETDNPEGYVSGVAESEHKESSPLTSGDRGSLGSRGQEREPSNEKSSNRSWNARNKNKRRVSREISVDNKRDGRGSPVREIHVGIPPHVEGGENSNQHFESTMPGSHRQIGSASIDDLDRKHGTDGDGRYSRYIWSSSANAASGYGARGLEEQHYVGPKDNTDTFSGRQLEAVEMHSRESGIQSQVHLYRPNHPVGHYLLGQDPRYGPIGSHARFSPPYMHPAPMSEPYYRTNLPGMQWHAPRPDELHHTRMGAFGNVLPPGYGGGGVFEPRAPHHGHPAGPMAFTPGSRQPYPR
ncbi:PHD finger-containing protein [Morus notabilis]|uniref:PHD finger-containing protein n=1 Tax=Morus notabilis TaxID=981085 RepID=W9RJS3_9ROSA|nr:protein ENHANCED DOWNY MILDEW 2 [Morus notabilis]XP_024023673.1 protein ENHANCED DOWNY MILDEW 2 [Morus notabilis]XP_024023674.1 protein ENHANCED DOWNY MILDEW 2 [Morus notabilis]EXB81085.1 PHD finger-containing protein [Morus notabilis]